NEGPDTPTPRRSSRAPSARVETTTRRGLDTLARASYSTNEGLDTPTPRGTSRAPSARVETTTRRGLDTLARASYSTNGGTTRATRPAGVRRELLDHRGPMVESLACVSWCGSEPGC